MTHQVTAALEQNLAGLMVMPQRLMQAQIEILAEGMNFMSRRMKAQAAFLGELGQVTSVANLAQLQRNLVQNISRDWTEEANEISEIAHRNLNTLVRLAQGSTGVGPGLRQFS
ncbi:phasin family protein [Rhabdaerophilum sp.]|uniref:phasin family protein n=1 Tax=Rhabdaerophilum sp. TaxID=2717341 RepID=UPI0038D37603